MHTIRIAALALLALPLAAAPAGAATVVGPAGSIQAAVDAAAPGDGITAAAANDVTIDGNLTQGNGDGGIAAIGATGVRMRANRTSGNRFGVYVGGSLAGSIAGNSIHDNCIGVLVLGQPRAAGR